MIADLETYAKAKTDPFLNVPFMCGHVPTEYKAAFPPVGWVLRKVVFPMLAWRHSGCVHPLAWCATKLTSRVSDTGSMRRTRCHSCLGHRIIYRLASLWSLITFNKRAHALVRDGSRTGRRKKFDNIEDRVGI